MVIYAINGSPRKNFSTAQLLEQFAKGADDCGGDVEVKVINLYDYKFSGCRECFACKLKDGKSYGWCAWPDDITQLLKDVAYADGIAFGSPVFFYDLSAQMKAFLERLMFPFTAFKKDAPRVIAPKQIPTVFFHSMNVPVERTLTSPCKDILGNTHFWTKHVFGHQPQVFYAYNTWQYTDYDKYVADIWDLEDKKNWKETQFPIDLQNAYDAGKQMVEQLRAAKAE